MGTKKHCGTVSSFAAPCASTSSPAAPLAYRHLIVVAVILPVAVPTAAPAPAPTC